MCPVRVKHEIFFSAWAQFSGCCLLVSSWRPSLSTETLTVLCVEDYGGGSARARRFSELPLAS